MLPTHGSMNQWFPGTPLARSICDKDLGSANSVAVLFQDVVKNHPSMLGLASLFNRIHWSMCLAVVDRLISLRRTDSPARVSE